MRSVLLVAGLVGLLALAGSGCAVIGGSNKPAAPPPLPRAQFVRAADRACRRDYRANKRIPNPTNLATLLKGLERAIPVLEREIFDLRGLAPPRSDAALFARVVHALEAQDLAARRLEAALEGPPDVRGAKILARRIDTLDRRLHQLYGRLGLPACVKAAT